MPYRPGELPTLREFIDHAIEQGCELRTRDGIVGPRGPVPTRFLIKREGMVIRAVVLSDIADDARLTLVLLESYARALDIATMVDPPPSS